MERIERRQLLRGRNRSFDLVDLRSSQAIEHIGHCRGESSPLAGYPIGKRLAGNLQSGKKLAAIKLGGRTQFLGIGRPGEQLELPHVDAELVRYVHPHGCGVCEHELGRAAASAARSDTRLCRKLCRA